MKVTQLFSTIFFLLSLSTPSLLEAGPYVAASVGGDIEAGGDAYTDRDPRFSFKAEAGMGLFALPVTFSSGQDVLIVGAKPRLQYFFGIPALDGVEIAPAAGATINYWNSSVGFFGQNVDIDVLELGVNLGAIIRYELLELFFIQLEPVNLDFNFFRKIWVGSGGQSVSDTNSKLGVVWSLYLGAGFGF